MDEFEEFENLTNSTFEHDLTVDQTTYTLVWEIILLILCIFGICINSAIIYTTFRYKKLNTVPNMFIANWSIADILLLVTLRSNYRIVEFIEDMNYSKFLIVFFYEIEYIFRNTFMLFVMAVLIDWVLASYFFRASQKFRKHYKFIIGFIWAINLIWLCVSLGLSLRNIFLVIPILFSFLSYFVFLFFIVGLYSFRGVQKCRKKSSDYPTVMLTLTTILMLSWIPLWLTLTLADIMYKYFWPLLECSYLSTSVVTFVVLYRSHKDFQACFQQVLKCSRNRYVDEISEFQSFPDNADTENQFIQSNFNQDGRGNC